MIWERRPPRRNFYEGTRAASEFLVDGATSEVLPDAFHKRRPTPSSTIVVSIHLAWIRTGAAVETDDLSRVLKQMIMRSNSDAILGAVVGDSIALIIADSEEAKTALEGRLSTLAELCECRIQQSGSATVDDREPGTVVLERAQYASSATKVFRGSAHLDWDDLGGWRLLFGKTLSLETAKSLSSDVGSLIETAPEELLTTWLVYLDMGRDVRASCALLHIQRTTLYHRFGRIRDVIGRDPTSDGWGLTSAHIALRVWSFLR